MPQEDITYNKHQHASVRFEAALVVSDHRGVETPEEGLELAHERVNSECRHLVLPRACPRVAEVQERRELLGRRFLSKWRNEVT